MDSSRVEAFEVLGIPADSDPAEVLHAYRRLARATHPDITHDPDAAGRFATVAAAYHLVSQDPRPTSNPVRVHESPPGELGQAQAAVRFDGRATWGGPPHRGWVMSTVPGRRGDQRAPIVAGPVRVDPPLVETEVRGG